MSVTHSRSGKGTVYFPITLCGITVLSGRIHRPGDKPTCGNCKRIGKQKTNRP